MRMKSRLVGLAVMCLGIPAAVVAQSRDEGFQGTYVLAISGPNMPTISAVSQINRDGSLEEFDYEPVPSKFGNGGKTQLLVGHGSWSLSDKGHLMIEYKTELPNKGSQHVKGSATFSASRNELTGSATVKLLNQEGAVVYANDVTVTGQRASASRLTAKR